MSPDPIASKSPELQKPAIARQFQLNQPSPLNAAALAVLKRPWIAFVTILVITVPVLFYLFSQHPKYLSQAVVSTAQPTAMSVLGLDRYASALTTDNDDFYYISILESNAYYDRILQEILQSNLSRGVSADSIKGLIYGSVSYSKKPRSIGFFSISATARSPEFAKYLAETALGAFQQITIDLRRHESNLTAEFIENQIGKLNENLGITESQIQSFLERRGFGMGDSAAGVDIQLRSLQRSLEEAQTSRGLAKLKVDTYTVQINDRISDYLSRNTNTNEGQRLTELNISLDSLTRLASDSLVQLDTTKFLPLQRDRESILKELAHLISGQNKSEGSDDNTRVSAKSLEQVLQQAFIDYESSQISCIFFQKSVDAFIANNPNLSKDILEYLTLTRNKDVLLKTIDILVEMREKTSIQIASETGGIVVIDYPSLPDGPVPQRRSTKALAALMFAIFCGVGICFAIDRMDNSIQSEADLQKRFNLPVYGSVPVLSADLHKMPHHHHRSNKPEPIDKNGAIDFKRLNIYAESSPVAEAYHSIMTAIRFTARDRGMKTFIITSPVVSEGKSLTTYNLGVSFARGGSRILIIDADLRRSSQHRLFECSREPGLTDCLNGNAQVEDCILKSKIVGLDILPAGLHATNPSALLSSHLIQDLLKKVEVGYDFILFDTPPITPCMDSRHLALMVGGLIMVIRAESTKINVIEHCLDLTKRSNTEVLGVIVNHATLRYGYGYYYLYQRHNPYGYNYRGYQYYYHQDPETGEKVTKKRRKAHSHSSETRA
jgi:polysaccharide biosynthesis transport protein